MTEPSPLTSAQERALIDAARQVRASAYAPYSKFRVGAAIWAPTGEVFSGANVENSAYPVGLCAEHNALGALASAGHRSFVAVVIAASRAIPPCGKCRQALAEFGGNPLVLMVGEDEVVEKTSMHALLPSAFRPDML